MKIAAVALVAGMMMTVALVAAVAPSREPAAVIPVVVAPAHDPLASELARCRVLTMPDAGCEATWEAHRRRFLGTQGAGHE